MSIEKEVERMYREDEEKQKKKQKKKKSSKAATLVLLILIIILALLLAKLLGLFGGNGFGFGTGGKGDDSAGGTADRALVVADSDADTESSAAEEAKVFENIKVSGSTYLYKGSEVSLEDLRDTFSMEKMNKDVVALIEDDNATQNTMEDLKKAFDDMGREYAIETASAVQAAESSAAE